MADTTFASGFKKLAHFAPAVYSAETFDAANTIIDVMKILASGKAGTMAITRSNVVKELHKIKYVGITKTISFHERTGTSRAPRSTSTKSRTGHWSNSDSRSTP